MSRAQGIFRTGNVGRNLWQQGLFYSITLSSRPVLLIVFFTVPHCGVPFIASAVILFYSS